MDGRVNESVLPTTGHQLRPWRGEGTAGIMLAGPMVGSLLLTKYATCLPGQHFTTKY